MITDTTRLTCHKCQTRHRIRIGTSLRDRSRSTCHTCGTRFGVVEIHTEPDVDLPERTNVLRPIESVPPDPQATPRLASNQTVRLSFHGSGKTLFGMQVVNVCLTLLTLGTYHFWAKAKVRKYLFSQSQCAGDRFAYHGTGKELYQGFLKAMVVFGIPYLALVSAPQLFGWPGWIETIAQRLAAGIIFVYVPIAMVSARRYRCSRTSWRGIRFSFRGRMIDFLKIHFIGWFFTVLTLGTYYPYFQTRRQAFLNSHTFFGNRQFRFIGHGSAIATPFALALLATYSILGLCGIALGLKLANAGLSPLLIPLVLGPIWIWFYARKQKYFWDHTMFGAARFHSTVTWQKLLTLHLGNLCLLLFTAGFAWPWVTVRNARFFLTNLTLRGPIDLETVLQDTTAASVTGEGLSNLLDTGFDLD